MLSMIKELKAYFFWILLVIFVLFVQAVSELAIPDYMSRIVNVGIQQAGIENPVPEYISKDTFNKILIVNDDKDKALLEESYDSIDKDSMFLKKSFSDDLTRIFSRSLIAIGELENLDFQEELDLSYELTEGRDIFDLLNLMTDQEKNKVLLHIDREIDEISESVILQRSISMVINEYESLGISTEENQGKYIRKIGFIMLAIAFISMIASILVGYLSAIISSGFSRDLRKKVFMKISTFSNLEFDKFSTASLITRSTNDIQQIQFFLIMLLRMVFFSPIMGVGGIIRALKMGSSMTWIIVISVLAVITLVIIMFSIATPKFKIMQKLVDRVNLVMRESLTGMMVIRAFNREDFEEEKFDRANKDLTKTNLFVARLMSMMMPTMMLIMNSIMLIIVWVGAHQIDKGIIQVGNMMAFMQYTMHIIMSFLVISMVSVMFPRASVSVERVSEILDTDLSIEEPADPIIFGNNFSGLMEFNNVDFKYPEAEDYVLRDISFKAKPGETTAIIGSTGSGKSTIVKLIPRFYDVENGSITIDGIDLRDISLKDLRNKIGYVPQKSILFTGSIESNLKFGRNNTISEADLYSAIEIAQTKNIISEREKGIKSEISQGGSNVSGGQRQRLSIARALAIKPQIFIFDDSFSALDYKTDATLREALKKYLSNSTIIIIAQRINTIRNADNIIVLDNGHIVGQGRHDDLIKNCNVYRQIALSQLSEEELNI